MKMRVLLVPMAGLALMGLAACSETRNIYEGSPEELAAQLVGQTSSYDDGGQVRSLEFTSASDNVVKVKMWNDVSWTENCDLVLQGVDGSSTRLVADCGSASEYPEMEVTEHARHILTGKPFDQEYLATAQIASFVGGMPGEYADIAEAEADKVEKTVEQIRSAQNETDGKNSSSNASDDGAEITDDWAGGGDDTAADDWGSN